MGLHPQAVPPVPDDTARVARAAFRTGNLFMPMRDALGARSTDEDLAALFPARGHWAESPWRLALVTVMPSVEGLAAAHAGTAVRGHSDWKDARSLALDEPGCAAAVLSEFRSRLGAGGAEEKGFDLMLAAFRARKLRTARGRQRPDSTPVLAAIRALNRLQCVGETLRHAVNVLAVAAPGWLRERSEPDWVTRDDRRLAEARLPARTEARQSLAERMGRDGSVRLAAIDGPAAPGWLPEIAAVQIRRLGGIQQYYVEDGTRPWRTHEHGIPPSARCMVSPSDLQAHRAKQGTTAWVGDTVQLTERCDGEAPRLITTVETSAAPTADGALTPAIHMAPKECGLVPEWHVVETGSQDAALLVDRQQDFGVDLVGPRRPDDQWQAREETGVAADHVRIDWEQQVATCPAGHISSRWSPAVDRDSNKVIKSTFASQDCRPCPVARSAAARRNATPAGRSPDGPRRTIMRCAPLGDARRRMHASRSMRSERGSR